MGRGSSGISGAGGKSGAGSRSAQSNFIVNSIVDAINQPGGHFTTNQIKQMIADVYGTTDVGDSFSIGGLTITKIAGNSWKAPEMPTLNTGDVIQLMLSTKNQGKWSFKSK